MTKIIYTILINKNYIYYFPQFEHMNTINIIIKIALINIPPNVVVLENLNVSTSVFVVADSELLLLLVRIIY